MGAYVARRAAGAVPLLFLISVAIFAILRAVPGGPLAMYAGDPTVRDEDLARLERALGLDQPLPLQYLAWLVRFAVGDWGYSLASSQPVLGLVGERLPNTLLLMGTVYLVTLALAIPVAVVAATRQYSVLDHLITGATFAAYALPTFWLGLLLILTFGLQLGWLPLGGMATPGGDGDLVDRLRHLVLPVVTLSLPGIAHYVRYLRASLLETIGQDYVRTARAKGLGEHAVLRGHALRNAAIPLVTLAALELPELFVGALVTEQIFGWPGMGRLFWDAATRADYPVLMSLLTVAAALIILANLVADLLYAAIDPRIRVGA